jgi:hypothetical protein
MGVRFRLSSAIDGTSVAGTRFIIALKSGYTSIAKRGHCD